MPFCFKKVDDWNSDYDPQFLGQRYSNQASWRLHAHIMAASFVTLFQWRLNSMLLQENEILLGVKDQIELLICQLDAVGSFTEDLGMILRRESGHGS